MFSYTGHKANRTPLALFTLTMAGIRINRGGGTVCRAKRPTEVTENRRKPTGEGG